MNVIPVIDIRHGVAVQAVVGDRANYRPLSTPLAPAADPVDVARGYMRLSAFPVVYVADLDGIEGRGANLGMLARIAHAIGDAELWADTGARDRTSLIPLLEIGRLRPVVGSETLRRPADLAAMMSELGDKLILSLDFRGDDFMGPTPLLAEADVWPQRVIVMTLARVGAGLGPDTDRIRSITASALGREVYAAGGVRNRDDLLAVRDAGASGALIASALHDGQIKTGDLVEIAGW